MSGAYPQLLERAGWGHPTVLGVRARSLSLRGIAVIIPVLLAFAISVSMPKPSVGAAVSVLVIMLGVGGVIALIVSTRYGLTLTLLVLYLGLLDGPVKLELSSHRVGAAARDVLIIAICLSMLMRLSLNRKRVVMPPLFGWVVAFVAVVLVEALNPNTGGILKSIGGYRQELEWVPFFFFGYLIVCNKQRFRQVFLLLGVIALANGVVGAYQSHIGPSQLAGWGPGYGGLVNGGSGLTGRTYAVEGIARVRPPALGPDAGFGGGVGAAALPGLLALLAVGKLRRRWPVVLCSAGALLAIATAASRTSIVIGVVSLVTFGLLSLFAGLRVSRPLAGLIVVGAVAFAVGSALVAVDGNGVFARQETLTSLQSAQESGGGAKERSLSKIPSDLIHAPLGYGLGTSAAASGFGGHQHLEEVEGEKVTGGSAYAVLMRETGVPGLFLWVGFSLSAIVLALRRLRQVRDVALRTYLVALVTVFIAFSIEGFSGATLAVTVGALLWFAPGVIAYWFAGPGWAKIQKNQVEAL